MDFCNDFSRDATATLSARRKIGSSIEHFVRRSKSRGKLVLVKAMEEVKVMERVKVMEEVKVMKRGRKRKKSGERRWRGVGPYWKHFQCLKLTEGHMFFSFCLSATCVFFLSTTLFLLFSIATCVAH